MKELKTIPELIIFLEDNKITDHKIINEMVKQMTGQGFFMPLLFQGDEYRKTEYYTNWLRKHQDKINKGHELPFFIDIDVDFKITDIYGKKSV